LLSGEARVIVEDASRFACELVVQEPGIALPGQARRAAADGLWRRPDSDDLGRKMMRQIAGDLADFEKGRSGSIFNAG